LRVALVEARAAVEVERQLRQAAEVRGDGLAAELAGVRRDHLALVQACAAADLRRVSAAANGVAAGDVAATVPAVAGLLPHQLRPAPKAGSLFHPDWDLSGLPCQSAEQVVQAWGSVYNVQLALEGYPSQYCAAFLVVLREGRRKRLYFLFSLKQSRHTLVCVPAQPAPDEAALRKLIAEGQQFLKRSGFAMDKLTAAEVPGMLGGYFRKT
jgi:hypothetical protein